MREIFNPISKFILKIWIEDLSFQLLYAILVMLVVIVIGDFIYRVLTKADDLVIVTIASLIYHGLAIVAYMSMYVFILEVLSNLDMNSIVKIDSKMMGWLALVSYIGVLVTMVIAIYYAKFKRLTGMTLIIVAMFLFNMMVIHSFNIYWNPQVDVSVIVLILNSLINTFIGVIFSPYSKERRKQTKR